MVNANLFNIFTVTITTLKTVAILRRKLQVLDLKKNIAKPADIKKKIQKNKRIFNVIKNIGSNIGILDRITFGDTKEFKLE